MKKLKSIFIVIIMNTLIVVGCANNQDLGTNDMNLGDNTNKEVVNELDEKDEEGTKETNQIENKNNEKDEDVDIETENNKKDEAKNENNEKDKKDEINKSDKENINEASKDKEEKVDETTINKVDIQLITMDVHTSESIPLGNVSIDENNDIKENLELVIGKISELKFDGAPIELLKIENNIAYIDIREENNKNYWSSNYFQGSTGASITSFTLVENILQRNYQGKWIDGIYLSYEGKTDIEFDHLDMDFFGNVISR